MIIRRDTYLEQLCIRRNNGLIKVITGIRRAGKSYLMNELFYDWLLENGVDRKHIVRFAFDSADDLSLLGVNLLDVHGAANMVEPNKFMEYINEQIVEDEEYVLLLDEVQLLGNFEAVLNGYLRKRNLDIYVTGSNSKFLTSDILTEFRGRGDEIHVYPLSFSEFFSIYDGSSEEAFDNYSIYGGLPLVALMNTDSQKAIYLKTQMENLYLNDIAKRYNLQGDSNIAEVLDIMASGISTLVNPKRISDTFKSVKKVSISSDTVRKYIGYLEESFLVKTVKRYDVKGRKLIDTPFKIYFEDIGLRNVRLDFRQIEQTHIMENIIFNELRIRGYTINVGDVEVRRTNANGEQVRVRKEIDFIASKGSKKYYIQSAYAIPDEEKRKQETEGFDYINDSFKKIVIVDGGMKARRDEKGYMVIGIREFLLNPESFDA